MKLVVINKENTIKFFNIDGHKVKKFIKLVIQENKEIPIVEIWKYDRIVDNQLKNQKTIYQSNK